MLACRRYKPIGMIVYVLSKPELAVDNTLNKSDERMVAELNGLNPPKNSI